MIFRLQIAFAAEVAAEAAAIKVTSSNDEFSFALYRRLNSEFTQQVKYATAWNDTAAGLMTWWRHTKNKEKVKSSSYTHQVPHTRGYVHAYTKIDTYIHLDATQVTRGMVSPFRVDYGFLCARIFFEFFLLFTRYSRWCCKSFIRKLKKHFTTTWQLLNTYFASAHPYL